MKKSRTGGHFLSNGSQFSSRRLAAVEKATSCFLYREFSYGFSQVKHQQLTTDWYDP
jgi:hypothetical protein